MEGQSYSRVCGRVKGHGWATLFQNTLFCNYSLEKPYVAGVTLTHGPAGRRIHIWTFAAAYADGYPYNITENCGCSNTSIKMTHATPDFVGHDYFCDSNRHYTVGSGWYEGDADGWGRMWPKQQLL